MEGSRSPTYEDDSDEEDYGLDDDEEPTGKASRVCRFRRNVVQHRRIRHVPHLGHGHADRIVHTSCDGGTAPKPAEAFVLGGIT